MVADRAIRAEVVVAADAAEAFGIFTAGVDTWWRDYFNLPNATAARLEPGLDGRFLELEDDGPGFEVGRITAWEPGHRLALSWRQANWEEGEQTLVEVAFTPADGGTLVALTHTGWSDVISDPGAAEGYAEGWQELLGWYAETAAAS